VIGDLARIQAPEAISYLIEAIEKDYLSASSAPFMYDAPTLVKAACHTTGSFDRFQRFPHNESRSIAEGALVHTALSGAEGLQKAEGKPVDLVISDLSMPEMDGNEFLLQLRRQPDHTDVPAIALTGYGREEDMERAREAGFNTLLIKPLDFDALLREARAALRK
jgi:CheY-like chemotaxis protein